MKKFLKWFIAIIVLLCIGGYFINAQLEATVSGSLPASDHYKAGKFHNLTPGEAPDFAKLVKITRRYFEEEQIDKSPDKPLPLKTLSREQLDALDDQQLHIVKLGHSSMLLKVRGKYWLLDPVFSDRASPFSFLGPKRFQETPITIADLPPIDKVLISHNHYDHLDKAAILELNPKVTQFLVPLGVDGDLQKWGVDGSKVKALDWWQELSTDEALIAFTPSQHFSGRGLSDRNKTLWGSWVIKTAEDSLYYSGDSGYFDGFKTIGEKYGPFDLTVLETGAYNTDWPDVHLFPEESVQANIDLRGNVLMPVHNSTFDLAFHPWYEPLDRVSKAAEKQGVKLTTPLVGELFTVKKPPAINTWWKR